MASNNSRKPADVVVATESGFFQEYEVEMTTSAGHVSRFGLDHDEATRLLAQARGHFPGVRRVVAYWRHVSTWGDPSNPATLRKPWEQYDAVDVPGGGQP